VSRGRRYGLLPPALLLAVAVRTGWICWALGAGIAPASDAGWYFARAGEIAAGAGYAIDGAPTAYWPVGYPGFLGLLFSVVGVSVTAAMIANIIFYCIAIVAVHRIARTIFASDRAAGIAALILALYPNHIAYSALLLSESLFIALLMAGIALLIDARGGIIRLLAAGASFGIGTLVKPQMIVVPALCFAAAWIAGRRRVPSGDIIRRAAIVYLVIAVAVLPWMARNHAVFGRFGILSNNDGINLFIGNNPSANGTYLLNDTIERAYAGAPDEPSRNELARRLAIGHLLASPLRAVMLLPAKLWYLYRADAEGFSWAIRSLPPGREAEQEALAAMKLFAQLCYLLLGATFVASLLALRRGMVRHTGTPYHSIGLWIVIYFSAIPLVYFGDGRFHFPAIPWMAIYAGAWLGMMIERRKRPAGDDMMME